MSKFIDIHTHTDRKDDLEISSVRNIIVGKGSITTGLSSVGIHPWYIDEHHHKQFEILEKFSQESNVIAIGECGLDKLCDTPWDKQVYVFERQVNLAKESQLPLIIHCVKAYAEILQILKLSKFPYPVIFHGFSKSNLQLAQEIQNAGYYISFGTSILNKKQDYLIKLLPLEYLFFETDMVSISVEDIYHYFCTARKMDLNDVKDQIEQNFKQIFGNKLTHE